MAGQSAVSIEVSMSAFARPDIDDGLSSRIDNVQRFVREAISNRVKVHGLSAQFVEPSAIDEWSKRNRSFSQNARLQSNRPEHSESFVQVGQRIMRCGSPLQARSRR